MITMALERTYIIPLRKEWLKAPKYKRAKKAMTAVKEFLAKHMKSDNVKIGTNLNMKLWERGIKSPPHKLKVSVIKEDDGTVKAELFGLKYQDFKVQAKKKQKTKKDELMEKLGAKPKEEKPKKEKKIPSGKEEKKAEEKAE